MVGKGNQGYIKYLSLNIVIVAGEREPDIFSIEMTSFRNYMILILHTYRIIFDVLIWTMSNHGSFTAITNKYGMRLIKFIFAN